MKKRIISLFTSLVMVMSLVGVVPSMTVGAEASGDFEYEVLTDGTVKITNYTGTQDKIVVPSEIDGKIVTSIGYRNIDSIGDLGGWINDGTVMGAFEDCTSSIIELPDTITQIDKYAFVCCNSLKEVKLSKNLAEIGDYAFYRCESLSTIRLPENLKNISYCAFANCESLESIEIPNSVETIENNSLGYSVSMSWPYEEKNEDFVIRCYSDTAGEKYAKENGFSYEIIDATSIIENSPEVKLMLQKSFDGKYSRFILQVKQDDMSKAENALYSITANQKTSSKEVTTFYNAYKIGDEVHKAPSGYGYVISEALYGIKTGDSITVVLNLNNYNSPYTKTIIVK